MNARRNSSPCRFDGHFADDEGGSLVGDDSEGALEGGPHSSSRLCIPRSSLPSPSQHSDWRGACSGDGFSHWGDIHQTPSPPPLAGSSRSSSGRFLEVPSDSRRQHRRSASARRRSARERNQMFGRRGYTLREWALADADSIHYDKGKTEVATDSDDGVEAINVERYAINKDPDQRSFESLRAAITAGIRKEKSRYDCRKPIKRWLSQNGLMICKVLLFLFLLSATVTVTMFTVRASQIRMQDEPKFSDFLPVEGHKVVAYTSCGPVQGWLEDGAFAFRGIPYALPPEGRLRWKPPVPLERLEYCWNDTLITRKMGDPPNSCWQTYRNGSLDGSEDCLTLDVFAPRTHASGQKSPIVVLVAAETLGGGGGKGFVSPQLLSPSLARLTGVVFIRIRFRLGALGFLSSTVLTQSEHPPRSGNYGVADVRAALKWVNLNANSFGADHTSITVLGHRAGATLVLALAASKKASQLFSRVWLSSPSAKFPTDPEENTMAAQMLGNQLVRELECTIDDFGHGEQSDFDAVKCLQEIDAEDILDAVPEHWKWRAVDLPMDDSAWSHDWLIIDGDVVNEPPLPGWMRHGLNIPIVIGTTTHAESTAELKQRQDWRNPGALEDHIQKSDIGKAGLTSDALSIYSTSSTNSSLGTNPGPLSQLTAMITDIRTICPLIDFTRLAAKHAKNVPVYFYIMESIPEESGAQSAMVSKGGDEPDWATAAIGPGTDLLGILNHNIKESGEQLSSVARMFYTFVRHGPTGQQRIKKDYKRLEDMEQVGSWPDSKMPRWLLLVGQDGHVEAINSYPTCTFWKKNGFVPKYARSD